MLQFFSWLALKPPRIADKKLRGKETEDPRALRGESQRGFDSLGLLGGVGLLTSYEAQTDRERERGGEEDLKKTLAGERKSLVTERRAFTRHRSNYYS